MARVEGSSGDFRGKLGGIIYYRINGVTYARQYSVPNKKKPPSDLQKISRKKFGMVSKFLSPIKEPVEFGFQEFVKPGSTTGMNVAQGYAKKNAFEGGGVDPLRLIPGQVKISRGPVTGVSEAGVEWLDEQHVRFYWHNNHEQGSAKGTDQVMVLLYNNEVKKAFSIQQGASRSMEEQTIKIQHPDKLRGTLHAYIAFHRKHGRKDYREFSDSQYLGVV